MRVVFTELTICHTPRRPVAQVELVDFIFIVCPMLSCGNEMGQPCVEPAARWLHADVVTLHYRLTHFYLGCTDYNSVIKL